MGEDKPVVYILYGDDIFAIQKFIAALVAKLGDPSIADLNTNRLDGRLSNEEDIHSAALSMPFLAERRLVIVTHPLARLTPRKGGEGDEDAETGQSSKGIALTCPGGRCQGRTPILGVKLAREHFIALLDRLPATTALMLVIDDSRVRRRGEWDWDLLNSNHWLVKWAQAAGKRAMLRPFPLPTLDEMPAWVRRQAEAQGGMFSPLAVRALAVLSGSDTELAAQEITKLLTYVNYKRPVEEDDVLLLTAQTSQANIFNMVDAIGERNSRRAVALLHNLLETSETPELFGMIVRQFRLLLQAREILDEGGNETQVTSELKLNPYITPKLCNQARSFSMPGLEAIYHRLLAMDEAIKTSQIPADVAFDTFIAEIGVS
jgi:DNA polymerase-3 subunit delta